VFLRCSWEWSCFRDHWIYNLGREDLRALYSDIMKTLHEEAFYEGVYQPEEVEYAIKKVEECVNALEKEVREKSRDAI